MYTQFFLILTGIFLHFISISAQFPAALSCSEVSARDSLTIELSMLAGDSALIGYAAAIISADTILYAHGFGYAHAKDKIPYTTKTVQPIASISKTLIGISLMKAEELGLFHLDDNINAYLPFTITNPHQPDSKITIKTLANHTSGLRDTRHYENSYVFDTTIPRLHKNFPVGFTRLMVKRMVKGYNENEEMPLSDFLMHIYVPGGQWYSKKSFGKAPPGEVYAYSNNGAAIASLIIERASGLPYTEFVERYILVPLEMNQSGWDLKDFSAVEKSRLYPFYMEIPDYKLITLADGGFITNVEDFSKYLASVIRGYNGENNIISAGSYDRMLKDDICFGEGVFWNVGEIIDDHFIGHTGGDPGVQTIAIFDKRSNLGYICFSNTNTPSAEEVDQAVQLMIRYSPRIMSRQLK